jgi:hypothetical protein
MKKAWQKPKLVVLLRSKPNEAILTVCKLSPTQQVHSGPMPTVDACYWRDSGGLCSMGDCFTTAAT